jgi:hypothetical protein
VIVGSRVIVGVSVGCTTWVGVEVGGMTCVAVGCGVSVGVSVLAAIDVAVGGTACVGVAVELAVGVQTPVDVGVAVSSPGREKPPACRARVTIKTQAATTSNSPTAPSRTNSRELHSGRLFCPLARFVFCAMGPLLVVSAMSAVRTGAVGARALSRSG